VQCLFRTLTVFYFVSQLFHLISAETEEKNTWKITAIDKIIKLILKNKQKAPIIIIFLKRYLVKKEAGID